MPIQQFNGKLVPSLLSKMALWSCSLFDTRDTLYSRKYPLDVLTQNVPGFKEAAILAIVLLELLQAQKPLLEAAGQSLS